MPLEQLNNSLVFRALFTASKLGKTGLTVTVDVYNPAGTKVVTDAAATEVGGGLYGYTLASGSVSTDGEYTAVFKTADNTVDFQHVAAQWSVGRAGIEHNTATAGSGAGANPVTLTFRRSDNSRKIPNLNVTIWNSDQTAIQAGPRDTDVNGQVVFNLDSATYKVVVESVPEYETLTPQTLVVSGTTTATYDLTPADPGPVL